MPMGVEPKFFNFLSAVEICVANFYRKKSAIEKRVSLKLLKVCLEFGALKILLSKNHRKFVVLVTH